MESVTAAQAKDTRCCTVQNPSLHGTVRVLMSKCLQQDLIAAVHQKVFTCVITCCDMGCTSATNSISVPAALLLYRTYVRQLS